MVIAVANNGAWQVKVYDHQVARGRVVGTKLEFSNQAAMARAFGLHGERVEKPEELPGAVDRAFANPAALLDVVVTPRAVSSDARTGLAWVPDLRPLAALG
jgi:acetolactate synthase I/II/III large subunit